MCCKITTIFYCNSTALQSPGVNATNTATIVPSSPTAAPTKAASVNGGGIAGIVVAFVLVVLIVIIALISVWLINR